MYFACDMKSYYASVECAARGLDPLTTRLLVADESRTDKTICLAVSPALKAIGVPSRPRLFEAKQAIALYEAKNRCKVDYIIAEPRMAEYIRISSKIYEIAQRYAAPDDIHVYSVDEFFVDAGPYARLYGRAAEESGLSIPRYMARSIIREVLAATGITATVGIGTNLYLAKIAMDIVAKKAPPDRDGVRIAALDEEQYRRQLWTHRPLTDFWHVGPGTAARLLKHGMRTMGDVASVSLSNPEILYKLFGVDAELLIDHAWGIETATMADIKSYRAEGHSLSTGQVLPRAYAHKEGFLVFREMADLLCSDLAAKNLTADCMTWWIIFDPSTLDSLSLPAAQTEELLPQDPAEGSQGDGAAAVPDEQQARHHGGPLPQLQKPGGSALPDPPDRDLRLQHRGGRRLPSAGHVHVPRGAGPGAAPGTGHEGRPPPVRHERPCPGDESGGGRHHHRAEPADRRPPRGDGSPAGDGSAAGKAGAPGTGGEMIL